MKTPVIGDKDEDQDLVLSEVHLSPSNGSEPSSASIRTTTFNAYHPSENSQSYLCIKIQHRMGTSLNEVGKQLWRGAFLLADFILSNKQLFENSILVELGSGLGFCASFLYL
jgi:methyltransferase-like protein 22